MGWLASPIPGDSAWEGIASCFIMGVAECCPQAFARTGPVTTATATSSPAALAAALGMAPDIPAGEVSTEALGRPVYKPLREQDQFECQRAHIAYLKRVRDEHVQWRAANERAEASAVGSAPRTLASATTTYAPQTATQVPPFPHPPVLALALSHHALVAHLHCSA